MGTCIICGTPCDGEICELHEEDVAFDFEGTAPSQLTPGRYYRGTVDGYADFGVFVDVGDHVTGLLHRSELDVRLESLDWEPGDDVYVQVLDVRDNGNVDLGWSIRQSDRDFRGKLIDTPEGERQPEDADDEASDDADDATADDDPSADVTEDADAGSSAGSASGATPDAAGGSRAPAGGSSAVTAADPDAGAAGSGDVEATASDAEAAETDDTPLKRTTVDALDSQIGSVVRLEGTITGVRQTSGPTVFELRDETATVECAAFEEAGVRAYPDVDVDDVVALEGEVENHHGDLQVETESLEILSEEDRETVEERLETVIEREASPPATEPLADYDDVTVASDEIVDAATAIRRAVMEARPIVVRHNATVDGYVAGAAIERAVLPLLRDQHTQTDAVYHYFERRPLDGRVYGMDAATDDVTSMLEARDRHGEQLPLVVLVDAGATPESFDAYELLDLYGAESLVVDDSRADASVADAVSVALTPAVADVSGGDLTTTALAANVAAHVNGDVRDDLEPLPAISYWEDAPEAYADLAADAGYDDTALSERREAVALEAYYQSYNDKRELVADLLFDEDGDLAAHVSEQFRDKLSEELETARENATVRGAGDVTVTILDTDAYTHRFDFPSTELLLDELHRAERDRTEPPVVTLGLDEDELHVRATEPVDVTELGESVAETVPDGGVRVVGGRDGRVEFLPGTRDDVREAAVDALAELLG